MKPVLAVMVAYHPESETLENAKALLQQVSHLVIVDNETNPESKNLLEQLSSFKQVTFLWNESNRGVAEGFNQGLRWGLENGFDNFLLMDQDSRVTSNMVSKLVQATEMLQAQQQLGIVGPEHQDFNYPTSTSLSDLEIEPAELLITSGSFLTRQIVDRIGLYDERLFIDHVDHDYCLRLKQNGGMSYRVPGAILSHRFGQAERGSFLGCSFFLQNYSPFRRYFMMRNRIVLYKRYGMFTGEWFWLDLRSGVVDLVKLVFFERDKASKLRAVVRGFFDGLKWRD